MAEPREVDPGSARGVVSGPLVRTLIGVIIVAAVCLAAATPLFFLNSTLLIVPIAALLAAGWTRQWLAAALAAAGGVLLAASVAGLVADFAWLDPVSGAVTFASSAVMAGVLGALASLVRSRRWFGVVAPALVLAALVVVMGLAVMGQAYQPPTGSEPLVRLLAKPVTLGAESTDEMIYLAYLQRQHAGEGYYPAAVKVLSLANERRRVVVPLDNPLSYRLPTIYAALAPLAENPRGLLLAGLAMAAMGVLSAFALARRFVSWPVALIGAALVASYLTGYLGGLMFLDAEIWSGVLGLAFVAAFVWSDRLPAARWLALGLAVAAAGVRELGIAFVAVGLIGDVLVGDGLRWRRSVPWLAALLLLLAGYAAHWATVMRAVASAGVKHVDVTSGWLQPFGAPFASSIHFAGLVMAERYAVAIAFAALGLIGAVVAGRRSHAGLVLTLVVIGGAAVLLFLGPSGVADAEGFVPQHWGAMIMPSLLASVPLVAAPFVREARGREVGAAAGVDVAPMHE